MVENPGVILAAATLNGAEKWKQFAREYQSKVFSVTSFVAKRQQILQHVSEGIVVDLGCGPLGVMLRDIQRLPGRRAVGSDFCLDMITESRRSTAGLDIQYVAADNRCLPFRSSSIDTIISVNSVIPETRAEVSLIFEEVSRVLRENGRFVAVLPSFEMSLIAKNQWGMAVQLDLVAHREWDTLDWQCFYTTGDIERLMGGHHFAHYQIQKIAFSAPEEVIHIRQVYAENLKGVAPDALVQYPLFEHLLIAER
jgi:ubiquinone/menaquinone biosynthesis C-methylase UbiE